MTSPAHKLGTDNEAPEGCFVDLSSDGAIRALDQAATPWGFDTTEFVGKPSTVFTAASLSVADVKAALTQARNNGGGIVQLPAGTATWNLTTVYRRFNGPFTAISGYGTNTNQSEMLVPANTIIQGAGIGQTIIKHAGNNTIGTLGAFNVANVVIRDLTIDCGYNTNAGICIVACENVLIERVKVTRASANCCFIRYSHYCTVRYSEFTDSTSHGLGCKDGFEKLDGNDTQARFDAQYSFETVDYGGDRSDYHAYYSNSISGCGVYGLDTHSRFTEICGNAISGNRYGAKHYNGQDAKWHHNLIGPNTGDGLRWSCSNDYPAKYWVKRVWITKNKFVSDRLAFFESSNATNDQMEDVILNNNTYTSGAGISVDGDALAQAELRTPSGSTETGLLSASQYTITAVGTETDTFEDACGSSPTPIIAGFSQDVSSGNAPLAVTFTDTSTADSTITAWVWEYSKDGAGWVQFSTAEDPSYEFVVAGTYTIRLTVTSADGSDSDTDTVTVDVQANASTEILTNPSFDSGTTGWTFYSNGSASYSASGGDLTVAVVSGSTSTQVYQSGISLTNGTIYTLEFVAYANANVNMPIYMIEHVSPYANVGLSEVAVVTTTAQTFRYQFTANQTDSNCRLRFVFNGVSNKDIVFQSVSLKEGAIDPGTDVPGPTSDSWTVLVTATTDDFERRTSGYDITGDPRVYDAVGASAGVRFQLGASEEVPALATIDAAYLSLYGAGAEPSTFPDLDIYVEDSVTTSTYSDDTDYDARSYYATPVAWAFSSFPISAWTDTVDISALVQYLVDTYDGLSDGDDIAFKIAGTGSGGDLIKFKGRDNSATLCAKLTVEFTTAAGRTKKRSLRSGMNQPMRFGMG